MKNLFKKNVLAVAVLVFQFCMININAQIIFEHAYDTASFATSPFCGGLNSQLLMVNFEVSGQHYVKINRCGKNIEVFDLNHNLTKTINTASLPIGAPYNGQGSFLYLSEKLFNTDSKMEFMYVTQTPTIATYIYNEDGILLFNEPGAPFVSINVHQLQYPIYNTSQGTKMILSYTTGIAKVFGLGGTLTTAIQKTSNEFKDANSFAVSSPSPNPVSNQTQVNYVLPQGINEAEIVLYDMQGKEIKRYRIDKTFDNLLISTSDISAGTYFYQLQTGGQNSGGKKMVVIK